MLKTFKTILSVAVAFTLVSSSAYSDAIGKWAKGEFSLSTLSEKERMKELKWFQDAAKPFKGMSIKVLSETIPTHVYESEVLTKAFEEITGIKVFIRNKKNNAGQVSFEYKDLDQLNRLIMVIKANY